MRCPKCHAASSICYTTSSEHFDHFKCLACLNSFAKIKKEVKKMPYMVIAKPGTVDYHNPSKTYETKAQAIEVAKSLAQDKQKTYCVVKIIAEARISKVEVEEFE